MAFLLIALVGLIGLPVLAWKGIGSRDNYFLLGLVTLVIGGMLFLAAPSPRDYRAVLNTGDGAQARASGFMAQYGVPLSVAAFGTAVGLFLGGAIYRTLQLPMKPCNSCGGTILAISKICKHCGSPQ